jgi:drug/metabolite transporter (DMT)-like permease
VTGAVTAGLGAALLSALALNWSYFAQHEAAAGLPRLTPRRPLHSLKALFAERHWLAGFLVGIAGWVLYVGALRVAPLSLVQAVSAGGIGLLAMLAWTLGRDRPARREVAAVAVAITGLVVLGLSIASTPAESVRGDVAVVLAWVAGSLVAAALIAGPGALVLPRGAAFGAAAGTLYAAGDVATKAAVGGGARLALVAVMLACHGLAFVALQLGFQRGGVLATAGVASLLTNAVPIVAGVAIFGEGLPPGWGGVVRVASFVAVVVGGAGLARGDRSPRETEPEGVPSSVAAARLDLQTSGTWS